MFGLSAAERFIVLFDDGSSAFVKAATDEQTDAWIRQEQAALDAVGGHLGPMIVAFEPEPGSALLITEDLSSGYWPTHDHRVDWRAGDVDALLDTLKTLGGLSVPPSLGPIVDWPSPQWADVFRSGVLVAAGLCSTQWAEMAEVAIAPVDERAALGLSTFVHGDVRSDNVVIVDGRALLVDWSTAGAGRRGHDLAQLLPTLHLEGAPEPWLVADVDTDLVVRLSGSVAARLAKPEGMPEWLQRVFLRLAAINLAWIAVLCDLAPPDGRDWRDV